MTDLTKVLIEDCEFSVRTSNILRRSGYTTLAHLDFASDEALLRGPNIGRRSLREVREMIAGWKQLLKRHQLLPDVTPRRLLDDDEPDGYLESDRDFVENNLEACVWFLEHIDELRRLL